MIINQFVIFSKNGLDFFNFSEQTLMESSLLSAYITSVIENIKGGTISIDDFFGILYLDPERRMSAGFTVYEGREVYGACSYYSHDFSVPDKKYCKHVLFAEKNYVINPKKSFGLELDENAKAQIELELTSDRFKRSVYEKDRSYSIIPIVWQKHKVNVEKGECETFSKILEQPKSQVLKESILPIVSRAKGFERADDDVKIRTLCYTRDIGLHLSTHFISEELVLGESEKILCYGILRGRREEGSFTELDLWVHDPEKSYWEGCYSALFDFTFDRELVKENAYDVFEALDELKTKIVSYSFTHKGQKLTAIFLKSRNLNVFPQNAPSYEFSKNHETRGRIIIVPEEKGKIFSNLVFERELDLDEIEEEDLNEFLPPEDILERFIYKTGTLYITSSRKALDHDRLLKVLKNQDSQQNNNNYE